MVKVNKHPKFVAVLLITIGFSFALGYGYYKNAVAQEQLSASVSVAGGAMKQTKPITFNLGDQGIPKKWLQPNQVLISSYIVKNEGDKPLKIQVKAMNFSNEVILETGAAGFQRPSSELTGTVDPGKTIRVKARINLSNINIEQTHQRLGELYVINKQNGDILEITPVVVMNSTASAAECCQPQNQTDAPAQHETHTAP